MVLILFIYKIVRKSNCYIMLFLLLILASCALEFFAQFAKLNSDSIDFFVYYYGGNDYQYLKRFKITYTMIGYLYYSSQGVFLWAHWMLAFVYLYTATTLWFKLTVDDLLLAQQIKF